MQLVLEKRAERSNTIALVSPLIAIGLTLVTMSILFAILGKNPITALGVYFIDPLTDSYSLQEIAVKATPLVMIAIGLSLCYLANVWNIGAEGQFLIGAVAGSWLAVKTQGTDAGPWVLPAMLVLARRRRRALCPDPGDLQGPVRRQRNPHQPDAGLCRRSAARLSRARPVARPEGLQLPDHRRVRSGRDRAGADRRRPAAPRRASLRWWWSLLARCCSAGPSRALKSASSAPRRARRASAASIPTSLILLTFAISGALAGLAGIIEVAGPVGHLQPGISPGYGFTAIIVAFLGRLNPVGILIAGLFLALTFIGGEQAQIAMKIPLDVTKVFQGILLFYVLACDSLILYRVQARFSRHQRCPVGLH